MIYIIPLDAASMASLTINERILLHLSRYDRVDPGDVYNIPWDLTQDGIATSLRISRAHASIELKKLKMAGKISENHAHIKGGKAKRKSYVLTPLGLSGAKKIRDFAEEEGIDIMPLLDMKRCDPDAFIDSLDDESKETLWLACALRCSVKRETLPETKQPIVPVDVSGNIVISDEVKRNMLSVIDGEMLKTIHSRAADYWISAEGPNRHERLYHLVKAGRMTEACKLLINDRDSFTDGEDLNEVMSEMRGIPERFVKDILSIKFVSSMGLGDTDTAAAAAGELMRHDRDAAVMYLADLALISGDTEKADALLSGVSENTDAVALGIRRAKVLADTGELHKAKDILDSLMVRISSAGDLGHLNEIYLTLATICIRMGVPEDAMRYLNKARSSASPGDLKGIYRKMSEVYDAMGTAEEIRGAA